MISGATGAASSITGTVFSNIDDGTVSTVIYCESKH